MIKPLLSRLMALCLLVAAAPLFAAPLPAVTVAVIEQSQPERTLHYLGRIESIQTVEVKTRTEGFIANRLFTDGQMVNAGDLLYEIEPALHHSAVAQAQAQLDSATASANLAQVNLTRLQQLGNNRAVSRADIDAAAAERDTTRAAVAQARAMLDTQKLQLSYTRIYAPIAGRIGHSRFHVGSLINAASGTLVNIVQLDPIRVRYPSTNVTISPPPINARMGRANSQKGNSRPALNWPMARLIRRLAVLNRWITRLMLTQAP